jgi:hypothetical protein
MNEDKFWSVLCAIFIVLVTLLGLWMTFAAPCELFKFYPAGEIPGRCLMHE